jgi:phycobilisome rod-core linker protein
MTLPLLTYSPKSQNQRVTNFEIPGDEHPRIFTTEGCPSNLEFDQIIWAAYRQVFNEQQILVSNRQKGLETQLRNRQITVRDFIRGLANSDPFRRRNYEVNNNYRFVQLCIQRFLGRDVYNEREKIAWSIVLATKGLKGFIDDLLDSEEYITNFGYDLVPYQRRRILPQRFQGELPFARIPRYGADYRQQLESLGYFKVKPVKAYRWEWQKPPYPVWFYLTGKIITVTGAALLTLGLIAVTLAAWGIISL